MNVFWYALPEDNLQKEEFPCPVGGLSGLDLHTFPPVASCLKHEKHSCKPPFLGLRITIATVFSFKQSGRCIPPRRRWKEINMNKKEDVRSPASTCELVFRWSAGEMVGVQRTRGFVPQYDNRHTSAYAKGRDLS